jgi:peptide/nickel transport system permease protein
VRGVLLRRARDAAAVVVIVAIVTFLLIHLAPGDPFSAVLADARVSPDVAARWRAQFGLDRPLYEQFLRYGWSAAHGELGVSISHARPVADVLAEALPNTLQLMAVALALSMALGVALGIAQAVWPRRVITRAVGSLALVTYSVPEFWLAIVLLLAFSSWLPWLPAGGMVDVSTHEYLPFWGRVGDRASHLVLPAVTLALFTAAQVAQYQRVALGGALSADYIRTARAKGASPAAVVFHHAWRNALFPVITLAGLALPALFGGAVFVENVFGWPGMGRVAVGAIASRDYQLVMATVLIGSVTVAIGSAAADVLNAIADPRTRRGG